MPPEARHAAVEAAFAAALVDPRLPPPAGLIAPGGGPIDRRFAVHRATSTLGTIAALATRHPVLERLLGAETFVDLARAFLAVDRPRSALLLGWGDGLGDFVADHPDLAAWPWLADVARLEAAWARAHHAAEAEPLGLGDLAGHDPETIAAAGVRLHPSLERLTAGWAVATLWEAQGEAAEVDEGPEHLLVLRPQAEVVVHRTTAAGLGFVAALAEGASIAAAADVGLTVDPGFDAGSHLVGLVGLGAVVALISPSLCEEPSP